MQVCTQCGGNGVLQNGTTIEIGKGSGTFTASKQIVETSCPTCLGNKYMTCAGT